MKRRIHSQDVASPGMKPVSTDGCLCEQHNGGMQKKISRIRGIALSLVGRQLSELLDTLKMMHCGAPGDFLKSLSFLSEKSKDKENRRFFCQKIRTLDNLREEKESIGMSFEEVLGKMESLSSRLSGDNGGAAGDAELIAAIRELPDLLGRLERLISLRESSAELFESFRRTQNRHREIESFGVYDTMPFAQMGPSPASRSIEMIGNLQDLAVLAANVLCLNQAGGQQDSD